MHIEKIEPANIEIYEFSIDASLLVSTSTTERVVLIQSCSKFKKKNTSTYDELSSQALVGMFHHKNLTI